MGKKIKDTLVSLSKKSETMRNLYRKLVYLKRKHVYNTQYKNNEIDTKLVLFECFRGKSTTCNPWALYQEMLHNTDYKEYHFAWIVNNTKKFKYLKNEARTELIKRMSGKYYIYFSKAAYIVCNVAIPDYITLKEEQMYIQTWHGTPLKRLGCDIEAEGNMSYGLKKIYKRYLEDGKKFSYLLSPSAYATEKLASAFVISPERQKEIIIEEGYPRNDVLYQFGSQELESYKKKLGIPEDKKVILYAPTFRDDNFEFAKGFGFQCFLDFDRLKNDLSDHCVILLRTHYLISGKLDFSAYEGFVYNVSSYNEVNDLYLISDILITDYSSVFFDYANLKRPIIFYMYDQEEYQNEIRGLYLELSELPGPITTTQEQLTDEIRKNLSDFVYGETYRKFNEKFNYLDDGEVSRRVLMHVIKENSRDSDTRGEE